ncbi:hypothetical protein B0191_16160 [Leptospira interrogans serovar Hardjo]|nr:hypothetical protein B0191_16160 [Leptospira interrogans serovar Hardjo]
MGLVMIESVSHKRQQNVVKTLSYVVITFNCRFGELQSYTQLAPILETNFRSDRFIYIRFLVSF